MQTWGPPEFKHLDYRQFARFVAPLLTDLGHPRDTYDVVCVIREPLDWLESWWRYRSRETLADPSHPRHSDYTGSMSFDGFVDAFLDGRVPRIRPQAEFVEGSEGGIGVDRIFRYENLDALRSWMSARVRADLNFDQLNVSPRREVDISSSRRSAIRSFLGADYDLHEQAL